VANAAAEYQVTLTNEGARVKISGDLLQGVPFPPLVNRSFTFASIPVFNVHMTGTNASSLSDSLNVALRNKSPSAAASEVSLDANSNGTRYQYVLSFLVQGISSTHSDVKSIDLSWRSFSFLEDVKSGNYTLNLVLPTYLGQRIAQISQFPQSSQGPLPHTRRWYWNEQLVDNEQVTAITANVELFNFTSLSEPLEKWTTTRDPAAQFVRYEAVTGFNLTYHDQVTEVDEIANFISNAIHKVRADVEVPWSTTVKGDTLTLESGFPWSIFVMTTAIVAGLGLLASTVLLERRFQRAQKDTKAKKSRR